MTSLTKSPQKNESDSELDSLKDTVATQRALDYYLKPSVSQQLNDQKVFLLREGVSQEEAMVHASELLRCVIATAQGSSESLQGSHRDLVLGMVYFVELAKTCVDSVVDAQQLPAR